MTTRRHSKQPKFNKQYWEQLVASGRAWIEDDVWVGKMAAALVAAGVVEDCRA